MFTVEANNIFTNYDRSALAENAFYHLAAQGIEAWLFMGDSTIAYTMGGKITNRNGQYMTGQSSPVWLGATL